MFNIGMISERLPTKYYRTEDEVIEDPSIIDPDFFRVLTAGPEVSRDVVKRKREAFRAYKACDWPVEEMVLASELGYTPDNPARLGVDYFLLRLAKLREDSLRKFHCWIEDSYDDLKAAAAGLSLEEFIKLWQRLQRYPPWINEETGPRYIKTRLRWYIRGRRSGLDDYEVLCAMELCRNDFNSYLFLRRRLSRRWVERIIAASKRHGVSWTLGRKPQNVFKALRRGASIDQVVAHIEKGTLAQLAQRR